MILDSVRKKCFVSRNVDETFGLKTILLLLIDFIRKDQLMILVVSSS